MREGMHAQLGWIASMTFLLAAGCLASHEAVDGVLPEEPEEPPRRTVPRDREPPPDTAGTPPALGRTASALIGPEGGTVAIGELVLTIPRDALSESVEIRLGVTAADVAPPFTAYSPMYHFEPEGLRFARPVEARLPFRGPTALATVFWTRADGDELIARHTSVSDGAAVTRIDHFSRAFVGTACQGDCCTRANGELDLLMVVDNSNSMLEEQTSLTMQLPRMASILATGDLDGDGVQEFPAVESLHIGVVTPDMGTGGYTVPTCNHPDFGDDGRLRTEGNATMMRCGARYPAIAHYDADAWDSDPVQFASDVGCVALVGTGGCGFEQPLEASLKALTPGTAPIAFHEGSTGHGDGDNAGFLRRDSVLAVLQVTDEDDCSMRDPRAFDPTSDVFSGDLNLRCFSYPGATHPTDRYASGLLALRDDPANLVFAAITGIPIGTGGADPDYRAILDHPSMQDRVDPEHPTRLAPSCDTPGRGMAFPPRRIVETARSITRGGGSGVLTSICSADFSPAVDAILGRLSDRLSGTCTP